MYTRDSDCTEILFNVVTTLLYPKEVIACEYTVLSNILEKVDIINVI